MIERSIVAKRRYNSTTCNYKIRGNGGAVRKALIIALVIALVLAGIGIPMAVEERITLPLPIN